MKKQVFIDRCNKGSGLGRTILLAFCIASVLNACKREEKFPELGKNFANPADVAVSDDGEYFYVLNSDFDRTYNKGSILVLTKDGERVGSVDTNRLGRTVNVAGNDMLITYDSADDGVDPEVRLFDVSEPKQPVLKKIFTIPCVPINSVIKKNYKYFAVSCIEGKLLVGELTTNREDSTLNLVREYSTTRRALYLDTSRNLLFGFVTDMAKQNLFERVLKDVRTTTDTEDKDGADEVPDEWQTTKRNRSNFARSEIYQFFVYDLEAQAAKNFPSGTPNDPEVLKELRWFYFCLSNFDGTPDPDGVCDGTPDPGLSAKLYRTNFWDAKPDPIDPSVFYLSHRGVGATLFANDVLKVTLTGDPKISADGVVPKTASFLQVERVYGFPGEVEASKDIADLHYPGDIEIANINNRNMLIVNHFRDLVYWKKGEYRFGITAKVLGENFWFSEQLTEDPSTSYYQVAVSPQGKGISCSFYGNTVMLLDIAPGTDIKIRKPD